MLDLLLRQALVPDIHWDFPSLIIVARPNLIRTMLLVRLHSVKHARVSSSKLKNYRRHAPLIQPY
jgi:hypothetical protein